MLDEIAKKFQEIFQLCNQELTPELTECSYRLSKLYQEKIFPPAQQEPKIKLYPQIGAKNQQIILEAIPIYGFCSHHLIPMIGHAKISYFPPTDHILGFSTIHHFVDLICHSPILQEELTYKIYHLLENTLQTKDISITCEITHSCIALTKKNLKESTVTTSIATGKFQNQIR